VSFTRFVLLGACFGVPVACAIADIDFTGRKCPCVEGYVCAAGVCVLPGAVDAAPSSFEDGAGASPACVPRALPPRPSSTLDEPRLSFISVLRRMDLESPPGFDFPYYDLDGMCTTCPDSGATSSCVARAEVCDDPDGVDRSLNKVLAPIFATTNSDITTALLEGRAGVLVQVSDYNGLADDPLVNVEFFFSVGLEGGDGAAPIAPKFDGTDVYTILPSCFEGDQPRWRASGYVNRGRLITKLSDTVELATNFALPIAESVVVADIVEKDGKRWLSKGTWGGRVNANQLLTGLANTTVASVALCNDPSTFASVKKVICDAADITTVNPTPPGSRCDALTLAGALEGAPAERLGSLLDRPKPPSLCGDGYRATCD
jgi:hypothetical protein